MLRIIGGEFRRRVLRGPEGEDVTRPMPARVKESIFNLLRGWFEDANVLDLFAGVGTAGLEALSRGAKRVVLIEQNQKTFRILEQNIASLGCEDRAMAIHGDATSRTALLRAPRPVDILFVDPPYAMMREATGRRRVLDQIAAAREVMNDRSWVVLRVPDLDPAEGLAISGFAGPEVHDYGHEMRVLLYMPERGREPDRPGPPGG